MIPFLLGLMVGGLAGFCICCLIIVAAEEKDDDEKR